MNLKTIKRIMILSMLACSLVLTKQYYDNFDIEPNIERVDPEEPSMRYSINNFDIKVSIDLNKASQEEMSLYSSYLTVDFFSQIGEPMCDDGISKKDCALVFEENAEAYEYKHLYWKDQFYNYLQEQKKEKSNQASLSEKGLEY